MPEFVVAHGSIQKRLSARDHLAVGGEQGERDNLEEAHLRLGHSAAVIPVHQWRDLEAMCLLQVALQEELVAQQVHPALVEARGVEQVTDVCTFQRDLHANPAELLSTSIQTKPARRNQEPS